MVEQGSWATSRVKASIHTRCCHDFRERDKIAFDETIGYTRDNKFVYGLQVFQELGAGAPGLEFPHPVLAGGPPTRCGGQHREERVYRL